MPDGLREEVWKLMAERVPDVSRFIAPSRYYAERICDKLKVPDKRMSVIYNGINHEGFEARPVAPNPPVLGYFTRMCKDKGLDTLIDAFITLKQANHIPQLKLKSGGGCGPGDEPLVERMRDRLHAKALLGDVEFHPDISRQ